MSINLKANPDGISGAIQINGADAVPFNVGGVAGKLQSIAATQSAGALTLGLNPTTLDFRSATLTTGVPVTRSVGSAISLVVPSGATLGAVTTVAARLILVAIDNAGTVELAVVNISGGNDLSETGLINTTAISAAATANNVFYSTTARTGVAYRVVGSVDAVNTAGAWGNPTLVQGYGGQALAAMSSLGYGQTWQAVTRTSGTTYYNTTGRPILLYGDILSTATPGCMQTISISGGTPMKTLFLSASFESMSSVILIPPYASYILTDTQVFSKTQYELR